MKHFIEAKELAKENGIQLSNSVTTSMKQLKEVSSKSLYSTFAYLPVFYAEKQLFLLPSLHFNGDGKRCSFEARTGFGLVSARARVLKTAMRIWTILTK